MKRWIALVLLVAAAPMALADVCGDFEPNARVLSGNAPPGHSAPAEYFSR